MATDLAWKFNSLLRDVFNNYLQGYPLSPQKMTFTQREQRIFDNFRDALKALPKDFLRDQNIRKILADNKGYDSVDGMNFQNRVNEVCDFLLRTP